MSAVTGKDLSNARRLAQFAARRMLTPTACPYDPTGNDRQRALAAVWMREFLHRRPPAPGTVDHDGK